MYYFVNLMILIYIFLYLIDHILRWIGSLDVLSRHASIAKPQKRQLLIASLSSLQVRNNFIKYQ